MTTPGAPDPYQPPPNQPGSYQPPPAGGGYPPPGGQPPAGPVYGAPVGPAYPPPAGPAYPPPAGEPVDPNAFAGYPPPGPPVPPAAAKGGKKNRLIILGVVALVVIGVVIFAVVRNQKTATTAAAVGSCIKVTDPSPTDPKTSQADCTDPAAVFIVTETGGSGVTCDPNEASYTESTDSNKTTATVCLRPNVKTGDCWDPGLTSLDGPKKISCTDITTSLSAEKVLALITTSSDDTNCPSTTTRSLSLAKRNIVYCYGPLS